jgi:hypothetical protein
MKMFFASDDGDSSNTVTSEDLSSTVDCLGEPETNVPYGIKD